MKTYDEVYENIMIATNAHRQKVRKIQRVASSSAVFLTCVLGAGMFMQIEKPMSKPFDSRASVTVTKKPAAAPEETFQTIEVNASVQACSDTCEHYTTISYRNDSEVMKETTAVAEENSSVPEEMLFETDDDIFAETPEDTDPAEEEFPEPEMPAANEIETAIPVSSTTVPKSTTPILAETNPPVTEN